MHCSYCCDTTFNPLSRMKLENAFLPIDKNPPLKVEIVIQLCREIILTYKESFVNRKNKALRSECKIQLYSTTMPFASSDLTATTMPLTRYAFGSPRGLTPTHETSVPGTSPISKKRRRSGPFDERLSIFAVCPVSSSLIKYCSFNVFHPFSHYMFSDSDA